MEDCFICKIQCKIPINFIHRISHTAMTCCWQVQKWYMYTIFLPWDGSKPLSLSLFCSVSVFMAHFGSTSEEICTNSLQDCSLGSLHPGTLHSPKWLPTKKLHQVKLWGLQLPVGSYKALFHQVFMETLNFNVLWSNWDGF